VSEQEHARTQLRVEWEFVDSVYAAGWPRFRGDHEEKRAGDPAHVRVMRAKVPGGWLVRISPRLPMGARPLGSPAVETLFLPDTKHAWGAPAKERRRSPADEERLP